MKYTLLFYCVIFTVLNTPSIHAAVNAQETLSARLTTTFSNSIKPQITQFSPYLHLNSFTYSEPISIDGMLHEWNDDLHAGEFAFTQQRISIGIGHSSGWSLGWIKRYDYFLEFSEDTALLYHQGENDLPTTQNYNYQLFLRAEHAKSSGPQIAYQTPLFKFGPEKNHQFKAKIQIARLTSNQLYNGSIWGDAILLENDDIEAELNIDYAYHEESLFDRPLTNTIEGKGFSVDLFADWEFKQWQVSLTLLDAYYRVEWQDNPFTTATISTDTQGVDENGFIRYNPILAGLEGNKDFIQKLPLDLYLNTAYQWSQHWGSFINYHHVASTHFYQLGMEYFSLGKASYVLAYQVPTQALSLGFKYNTFEVSLALDSLSKSNAQTLAIQLTWGLN